MNIEERIEKCGFREGSTPSLFVRVDKPLSNGLNQADMGNVTCVKQYHTLAVRQQLELDGFLLH